MTHYNCQIDNKYFISTLSNLAMKSVTQTVTAPTREVISITRVKSPLLDT